MDYLKEYWEWQRNSYVQTKKTKDEYTELFNFNSQNGYAEPNQGVLTTYGKVYIEKMEDNKFFGYDDKGEKTSGSFKDIIRILMKDEVNSMLGNNR